jgi:heat shock protein HspQ
VEHVDDAAVWFTDQIPDRAVEVQHGVRDAPLAHLVVEAGDRHVVARAQSRRLDEELRHDEQRDALGAGRPAGIFASTRCTMFSDISCSAPEIHILDPNSR